MKSRYKGANKSNKSLLKKILILAVVIAIFIFSQQYVNSDTSKIISETTSVQIKS